MPVFDQSVARHVGLLGSNVCTPVMISSVITVFDSSNMDWSWSSPLNDVPCLSTSRNGNIRCAILKA